ncbi:MAG: PmoA family protein, partial [Cyclobacteriaceae bacterium]|nr:PmoA family protein [Cyclobacteriaceae bacterium]
TTEAGVWGKRAAWVRLAGSSEGKPIEIMIMNHPSSVNFPTYWHARGYGLFAANPLGQSVFEAGRGMENPKPFNFVIKTGEPALFKFRLIIHEGGLNADQIEAAFNEYSN